MSLIGELSTISLRQAIVEQSRHFGFSHLVSLPQSQATETFHKVKPHQLRLLLMNYLYASPKSPLFL